MKYARKGGTLLVMTIGAVLVALGFNLMLIPHRLLSGGVSGVSMIASYATGIDAGILYFALNFPILIWGWFALGREFIVWSVYSVVATSVLLQVTPVYALAADPILAAVFGGVASGFGSGLALRYGGSTGGADIIASIVTRRRDVPIGMLLFLMNAFVIAALALTTADWDGAMYSMLSIFTGGKVIDLIHVRHLKVTAFIITAEAEKLLAALRNLPRGVTVIATRGGYTGQQRDMLMTVTTRYELAALKKTIRERDPRAFVNIVETAGVIGEFRRT